MRHVTKEESLAGGLGRQLLPVLGPQLSQPRMVKCIHLPQLRSSTVFSSCLPLLPLTLPHDLRESRLFPGIPVTQHSEIAFNREVVATEKLNLDLG